MRTFVYTAALLCLFVSTNAFSQSSNATVSGTVVDATNAVLPGVSLTATNTATGVVTTVITNEAGVYNFASLLPGTYTIGASLPGFRKQTYTNVELGNAQQVRLNFSLQVETQAQSVEVTVAADTLIATSSSSVGTVLSDAKLRNLAVVGNNVLDLIGTMGGVRVAADMVFGVEQTTFAGISARNTNIQRDGLTVDAGGRYPTGIQAATRMNPDLVSEVRMILVPVDAEVGRGNGQVQILTRSGTNEYHGSAVYSVRNSGLDANTWANNRTQPVAPRLDWRNTPQYTASFGGPIVKNKTFFFALWDGVITRSRSSVNAQVLTPCARNGIFRYYDNWNNGDAQASTTLGATPTIAVVDALGNPRPPATNPDGPPHNGILRYASVFGQLQNVPARPDCSDAIVTGNPWDSNRTGYDTTGYAKKVLSLMPPANAFDTAGTNASGGTIDGLNVANHRWVRTLHGSNNLFSIGEEQDRNQVNVKIDHNIGARHKVNAAWSYERASSDDAYATWPNGWGGTHYSRPMVLTSNFTSTLSPSIVNEFRFGNRRTGSNPISPIETPGSGEEIQKFIFNVAGIPMWPHLGPTAFGFQNSQPPGGRGTIQITQRDITTLWSYADTLSWTTGKHTFKGGAEVRFDRSKGIQNGLDFSATGTIFGTAVGGDSPLAPISATAISATNMPGLAGTPLAGNNQRMRGLLSYLAGSLSSINQVYYINSPTKLSDWLDYRTSQYLIRDFHQNELAFFFKDDWKVKKRLTLNIGLRYEFYGVPYEANGLTASLVGGGLSAFGISKDFSGWMTPGARADLTTLEFIGPNSPNPDRRLYRRDVNNFGPAIGFAWQVPWFGEGKTSVRGGYQVTYQGTQRGNDLQSVSGFVPGSVFRAQFTGVTGNEYLDLTSLAKFTPVPPAANGVLVKPMQPIAITDRTQSIQTYDPNFVTPYVQNMTLAVTRELTPKLIMDVKYVGTLGLKTYSNINLNLPNFLYNGLREAFDSVRAGGESPLLNQMFNGINVSGAGAVGTVVNGVLQTAGGQLRADTRFNSNLATGNYSALATSLYTLNYGKAGGLNPTLPDIPLGVQGAVLRYNGFPENFIMPNPQLASGYSTTALNLSTTTGVIYRTNLGHNNYHSMEAQMTLRPTSVVSLSGTYVWSKNLGNPATTTFTNPVDREGDYGRLNGDRTHDFRTNGTFTLPVGPGKALFRNSSGVLARIVEGWETSWIVNLNSGGPINITTTPPPGTPGVAVGVNQLYNNGTADIVGPFPFKDKGVQWGGIQTATGLLYGSYFDPKAFVQVKDPQCSAIAANLQSLCTLQAIADAKTGQILLQNPRPGTRGNFGLNSLEGAGQWRFDASMRKSFKIGETKSLQFRIDGYNVLNHPEPQPPNLNINLTTTPFSAITTKTLGGFVGAGGTQRSFQVQARLNF